MPPAPAPPPQWSCVLRTSRAPSSPVPLTTAPPIRACLPIPASPYPCGTPWPAVLDHFSPELCARNEDHSSGYSICTFIPIFTVHQFKAKYSLSTSKELIVGEEDMAQLILLQDRSIQCRKSPQVNVQSQKIFQKDPKGFMKEAVFPGQVSPLSHECAGNRLQVSEPTTPSALSLGEATGWHVTSLLGLPRSLPPCVQL